MITYLGAVALGFVLALYSLLWACWQTEGGRGGDGSRSFEHSC